MAAQPLFETYAENTSGAPCWDLCIGESHPPYHEADRSRKTVSFGLLSEFWLSQFYLWGCLRMPSGVTTLEIPRAKTLQAFRNAYAVWVTALETTSNECPRAAEGPRKETWTVSGQESAWRKWVDAGSLNELENAIVKSEWLLTLEDDWDDEGAQKYSRETLDRALLFLKNHMQWAREKNGAALAVPRILPGPNGSIDLHWKSPAYEVLLNIPPAPALASFYGDDYGNIRIQGTLDPSAFNLGVLSWLIRR